MSKTLLTIDLKGQKDPHQEGVRNFGKHLQISQSGNSEFVSILLEGNSIFVLTKELKKAVEKLNLPTEGDE